MIKLNSKTTFTEQQGKYAARFSLDIHPNRLYSPLNLYFETPLTKKEYTAIKESIKPGEKVNINIEGILEALATIEFEKKSKRT